MAHSIAVKSSELVPRRLARQTLVSCMAGYLLLGHSWNGQAEPLTPSEFCQAAKKQTLARSKLARVFALMQKGESPDSPDENWVEFPNASTLNKMAMMRPIYDMATAWTLPSGVLFISMVTTSSTADWYDYTDYCYRPNGTLAWMESELRTLPRGGARRIRTWVFSLDGKITSQTTRELNLATGKPLHNSSYIDRKEPVFLTPMHLPFTDLLATVYAGPH